MLQQCLRVRQARCSSRLWRHGLMYRNHNATFQSTGLSVVDVPNRMNLGVSIRSKSTFHSSDPCSISITIGNSLTCEQFSHPMENVRNASSTSVDSSNNINTEVVQELKDLCNALYNDRQEEKKTKKKNDVLTDEKQILVKWKETIDNLLTKQVQEIELIRAYESGIAIVSGQKQFSLAHGLFQQMKQEFHLTPTSTTYTYLIQNIGLSQQQNVHKMLTCEEIESILLTNTEASVVHWERDLQDILRTEEKPLYARSRLEKKCISNHIVQQVDTLINEYLTTNCSPTLKDAAPFVAAFKVFVKNGQFHIPFTKYRDLLTKMEQHGIELTNEMYLFLLEGTNWSELEKAFHFLEKRQILEPKGALLFTTSIQEEKKDVDTTRDIVQLHQYHQFLYQMTCTCFKAMIRTFTSSNGQLHNRDTLRTHKHQLTQLYTKISLKLTRYMEPLLLSKDVLTQHQVKELYLLKIKASALAGQQKQVVRQLNEYIEFTQDDVSTTKKNQQIFFLTAMDIYPTFCFNVLNISEKHLHQVKNQSKVSTCKKISKLEKIHQELIEKSIPFSIQKLEKMQQDALSLVNDYDMRRQNKIIARNFLLTEKIREKIHGQRILKSFQVITRDIFQQADAFIDQLLDKMMTTTTDLPNMDVSLTLMRQYMTCANRFEKQLKRSHFFGDELVYRVFQLVDLMEEQCISTNQIDEEKLNEFYWLAARTCGLLWRVQETQQLLTRKKQMLNQKVLDTREYDLLIFLQCAAKKDLQNAYALLQEMHNAGIPPSKDTLHRIVVCRLQKMIKHNHRNRHQQQQQQEKMDQVLDQVDNVTNSQEADEKWLSTLDDALVTKDHVQEDHDEEQDQDQDQDQDQEWDVEEEDWTTNDTSTNTNLADIISFLQKWHNMTRVTPYGKTVVPILAQLLKQKDFYEFARFIQMLEYMGMTPATKVWLEKHLALYGKTLDEFTFSKK